MKREIRNYADGVYEMVSDDIQKDKNYDEIEKLLAHLDRQGAEGMAKADMIRELILENSEITFKQGYVVGFIWGCWYMNGGDADECTVGESDCR